jgi:cobalt-zinc-cadmium efflux system outer membrane protein
MLFGVQDTVVLTLPMATARALAVSPVVLAATGAVRAPRGQRAEARWPFPENPRLEYGRLRRQSAQAASRDVDWAVTQEIDVAGSWLARGRAASARIEAADSRVEDARRQVALEARRAYVALAIAERRAALTDSAAAFGERLAIVGRRLFDAGEVNRLEANAAILEAARARSAAERARAEAAAAGAELGRLVALPADSVPRATGIPSLPDLPPTSDSTVVYLALARRPDLAASERLRVGAARGASAARLAQLPTLTVGALGGREAGTDRLLGFAVGVAIPLFQRRQAEVGAADAERAAAEAEWVATRRLVVAEVQAARARFTRALAAERRFATDVLRAAGENLNLTERALAEGEVGLTEVLVLRTTVVNAQLEYLDVLRDAMNAWFELAAALAAEPDELATLLGGAR